MQPDTEQIEKDDTGKHTQETYKSDGVVDLAPVKPRIRHGNDEHKGPATQTGTRSTEKEDVSRKEKNNAWR